MNENKEVVQAKDVLEWARFFEGSNNRIVKQEYVGFAEENKIWLSTVFLGFDHNFSENAKEPVLWETMAFIEKKEPKDELDKRKQYEEFMDRCPGTWQDAEKMHNDMARKIKEHLKGQNHGKANKN